MSVPNQALSASSIPALELCGVTAGYDGKIILSGASLSLARGTTTGLLGRNGCGKTTLIHTALGLLAPTAGNAFLHGAPAWDASQSIRAELGFVPQQFNAFPWMTVEDCLELVGDSYPNWDSAYVAKLRKEWLPSHYEIIENLSPGQLQRLATLLAIGHKPNTLVLDEPVASMDPSARRDFFSELAGFAADGEQTVLLSSHITSDIERFCSHVAIMHKGKVVLHEALDNLRESVRAYSRAEASSVPENRVLARANDRVWVRTSELMSAVEGIAGEPMLLEDLFLAITS